MAAQSVAGVNDRFAHAKRDGTAAQPEASPYRGARLSGDASPYRGARLSRRLRPTGARGSPGRFALPGRGSAGTLRPTGSDGFTKVRSCGIPLCMDLPARKRLAHFIPPWIEGRAFFFITINCVPRGQNQICHPDVAANVLSTVEFYHEHLKWQAVLFLLMPDHVHGIISFPPNAGMKATIKAWKGYQKRFHGVIWQEDFFDHRLRDRFQMEEKFSYIMNNPVRKGLCDKPEDWPYVFCPQDRTAW
jgi:putative transposase